MSKKEKIDYFKAKTGINDDIVIEYYLELAKWDKFSAVKLYLKDVEQSKKNANVNYQAKVEFKFTDKMLSNKDSSNQNDKILYNDLIKFLKEKFPYITSNFGKFINLLTEHAGLIIVLSKQKLFEVRNNMIRAVNNNLCKDIIQNSVILPIMNDSEIGIEFIKKFSPKYFPYYMFCKYKNNQVMDIKFRVETKFRMNDVVNNLLDCFPEYDFKKSLYKSINATIMNIKKSIISGENKIGTEPDDDFSENPNNIDQLLKDLEKQMDFNEILGNVGEQNNSNNNIDNTINMNNQYQQSINNDNINNIPSQPNINKNRFRDLFNDDSSKILINNQEKYFSDQSHQNNNNINNKAHENINVNKDSIADIIGKMTVDNTQIIIPKEPDINNPDACKIKFASPKSDKSIERRFLKTDKIYVLYNYAQTLRKEILGNNNAQFDLMYGYPPINLGNLKNKTLYDEGLSPFSLLHMVEKK